MFEYILRYINELWFLLLEMAPWLMLGLIFAGLLKVYFPQKHIDKYLGKSDFRSAFNGSLLGVPMPLCSCGVIPTGISFFKNGASKGATNSFLISTPQTGVDSILATYSMLGWPFAILRPLVAFITGVLGGVLTNVFVKDKPQPVSSFASFRLDVEKVEGKERCEESSCGCKEEGDSRSGILGAIYYAFVDLLQDIAKWLILGFLVAALISVVLPNDFFSRFQGFGLVEILLVLAASIPIYICATGSIPIAAVLLLKGVSPGAALVFLMAGPATNVATITVLAKTMGKKSLAVYLVTIIGGAIMFGYLTNLFIPADFILDKIVFSNAEGHNHEMLPYWLQLVSAVFLLLCIPMGFVIQKRQKQKQLDLAEGVEIRVEGMTCSHCEANVKQNLEKIEGVKMVMPNRRTNIVTIYGGVYDKDKIKEEISNLGYRYIN